MYNLGYLIQPPTYMCKIGGVWSTGGDCTIDNICAPDPSITDYKIDFSEGSGSLHNWWEKLDLLCMMEWERKFMGSIFFVGWCSTLLWVPLLSDKYGRKPFFVWGQVLQFALMTVQMVTHNVMIMLAVIFAQGALTTIRINIGYLWLMELLPKRHQTAVGSGWNVYESFCVMVGPLYFGFVSNKWFYLVLVGYIEQVICLATCFFLPESPRLLVAMNRLGAAQESFRAIAGWNRK